MKEANVNTFMVAKGKYFNSSALPQIRQVLSRIPDDSLMSLEAVELKDPTTMLLISLFLGGLGVDRFMIGDTGMGILKLLTCGCCGILTIVDWFSIQNKTRSLNYNKFMAATAGLGDEHKSAVYAVDSTPETDTVAEAELAKRQELINKKDELLGKVGDAAEEAKGSIAAAAADAKDAVDGAIEDAKQGIKDLSDDIDDADKN